MCIGRPAKTRHWIKVGLTLVQRRRWWTNVEPTLIQCLLVAQAVADPECARGRGVSHILAEKRGVSFTLFKKMHENAIFSRRTPGLSMLDPPLPQGQTDHTRKYVYRWTITCSQRCSNTGTTSTTLAQHLVSVAVLGLLLMTGALPSKHETLTQCCFIDRPTSETVGQHSNNSGS